MLPEKIDAQAIKIIRGLSIDMVEKAKSGHPGLPLGAAPMAYTLWSKFLKHNPKNPGWHGRDRFILSAGHGSALLYSLLYLYGYGLTIDELKKFRQLHSRTPGHPEYGVTPGVEATTGPLGQGFAMGVGMAIAEKILAGCFNSPEAKLIDHYTYAIVSDGDLMEGISSEAASLAGTMKLSKLIYLYDDNHVTIEGGTDLAFRENVAQRFTAYGWHVEHVADGNDTQEIESAINSARAQAEAPSLIIVRTRIGYGSPKEGSAAAHGEPLGADAVKKTKEFLELPADSGFFVPDEVRAHFEKLAAAGAMAEKEWEKIAVRYKKELPQQAQLLEKYLTGAVNPLLGRNAMKFPAGTKIATRAASEKVMNNIEKYMSEFAGGSADLSPSTKTYLHGYGDVGVAATCSRNLHFGVREHAMGAIVNGIALHGGLIPYGATFLVFSDYMRPAIRLAAIMKTHSIFVFTHDSVALGEDGPTHQPVEHLSSLRMIPGLVVIRPADANETSAAWEYAVSNKRPVVLAFSRQALPVFDAEKQGVFEGVKKGAYILQDARKADILIMATGSEVHPALEAGARLMKQGIKARVVSMPSYELFMEQEKEYRDFVIPPSVTKRLIVEAGATAFWKGLAGGEGEVIGIDTFGASAPGEEVMKHFGFTAENIHAKALELLGKKV